MIRLPRRGEAGLPDAWTECVKSAVVRVMSLTRFAWVKTYGQFSEHADSGMRRKGDLERREQEVRLLREELRIKDARMSQIPPLQRPRYRPTERLAILELKALRGWSLAQTAKRFQVTPATVSSWQRRIDDEGDHVLVQLPRPVNEFPEFVGYVARRLKLLCPALGKRKIAALLANAGLHLGATTVWRMLREDSPSAPVAPTPEPKKTRVVTARRPNHVWHVDITTTPVGGGFWCSWLPFAMPQCWPFCWWVAVVVDHFSRRALGAASFPKQPTSGDVRAFLGRMVHKHRVTLKYIVCDRGGQFDNPGFRRWCRRRGIGLRYGAIGRHGSIAVVERFIRTMKESLRQLLLIPMRREKFQEELACFANWYNEHRPHETLNGRTPDEVYFKRFPANRRPRYEPRDRWPRGSPCAKPWALPRGKPGARLELQVEFHAGRRHLPILRLKRVA